MQNENNRLSYSYKPLTIKGIAQSELTYGKLIVTDLFGSQTIYEQSPLYNGAFYDKDTKELLFDTCSHYGRYIQADYNVEWHTHNKESVCTLVRKNNTLTNNETAYRPEMREVSQKSYWNEPTPTLTDNTKQAKRYIYQMGISDITFNNVAYAPSSVYLSPAIKVTKQSYIALIAEGEGAIEYSLIIGQEEVPILPAEQKEVVNEKMFYGLATRFIPDTLFPIIVKRNGIQVVADYKEILAHAYYWSDSDTYTISYTPVFQNDLLVNTDTVIVKAILRGVGSIKRLSLQERTSIDGY